MGAAPRVFAWPDGHPDVLRVRPERDLLRQRLHQQARLLGARSRHRDALRRGLPGDDRAVAVLSGDLNTGMPFTLPGSRFSVRVQVRFELRSSVFVVRVSHSAGRLCVEPEPRTRTTNSAPNLNTNGEARR